MRLFLLTTLTMIFFAANSLLCRQALSTTAMDAPTFTVIRTVSAALTLWLLVICRRGLPALRAGHGKAALALFGYMAFFSWAFVSLPAAPGTLILVVATQGSMLTLGYRLGERPPLRQSMGIAIAMVGLVVLLLPGLTAPPLFPALLMGIAGLSWGVYSVYGRGVSDPAAHTAGNFLRCLPLAACLLPWASLPPLPGLGYGIASGALCSAFGYILWYALLKQLPVASGAVAQLASPVFSAFGAVLFLHESFTLRLMISAAIILAGILYAELRPRGQGSTTSTAPGPANNCSYGSCPPDDPGANKATPLS